MATAADGGPADDLYRYPDLLGDVYVWPYLALETEHCFMLTDDEDTVVGYVVGTANTDAFAERAEAEWWPTVRRRAASIVEPTDADSALLRLVFEPARAPSAVVEQFPAHGHIDLLPQAQGHGMGRALMATLEQSLRSAGASAIHLGVSATNTTALGFYARLGFETVARDTRTVFVGKPLG